MPYSRSGKRMFGMATAALGLSFVAGALAAETVTVVQRNRDFLVKEITIAKGDTVHFTNEDEFLHQIYTDAPDFKFDSAEQLPGDVVDVEFPTEGAFDVLCGIHPRMLMRVNVK